MYDIGPLVERMCRTHFWIREGGKPRHVQSQLTAAHLDAHHEQRYAVGLCPISPGENTTRVACLDMDSHKGQTPWSTMVDTARRIKAVLAESQCHAIAWRSSGGSGIHIYLLWDVPQPARDVRHFLADILDAVGLKPGTGGVARSEVEVFPKQDAVPAGRFGSMFILPGAGKSEPLSNPPTWRVSASVPPVPPEPERTYDPVNVPEARQLREALMSIPNDVEYDRWRDFAFATHYALGDDGLEVFREWSAQNPKHDDDFLDNEVWPYIRHGHDRPITAATILKAARDAGWGGATLDPAELDDPDPNEPPAKARFVVEAAGSFVQGAAPSWLVKGVLPAQGLGVVFGESGAGKSFFMLDIAAAIRRGIPWLGYKTRPGAVVYVAAEGANGMRQRMLAYAQHHGIVPAEIGIGVVSDAPSLLDSKDVVDLSSSIARFGRPGVIVVDTLSQSIAGGDENSSADMGLVIRHCMLLARRFNCLVLLVHHSGKDKDKGARGHSSLRAACDVELEVTRFDERRSVRVSKLKDGIDGAEFEFELQTVVLGADEDGDPVTSCVISYSAGVGGATLVGQVPSYKAGRFIAAVADEARSRGEEGATREQLEAALKGLLGKTDRWKMGRSIAAALDQGVVKLVDGRFVACGPGVAGSTDDLL